MNKINKGGEVKIFTDIIKGLIAFIVFLAVFCFLLLGILMVFVAKDLPNEIKHCNPDTSMFCGEGR